MAFNPSPEVAVARDAAAKLGTIKHDAVDRIVVLYTTVGGNMGYASYGADRRLCAKAKSMAEAAYKSVYQLLENE